ncbi:DUF2625 domain-containing protein [Chitinophaga agrisoli]|uniref:DUF2625 domain-containing protein n=2 Tax=Chitinophaga agrisoli TaxID=2607653 RepID=A0A5B2VQB2_9BACT|nr:DUF2625 domain-containing protein [Chitinophaga agrisoli]
MRTLEELINTTEPGWPLVRSWIDSATNDIQILPCDPARAKEALYHTQVTTRSPMGAIIYHTGGLLVDHGWLRILGSGSAQLDRSMPDWNKGRTFKEFGDASPFLLVADDVAGGFFAVNGGGLGNDRGSVYYLSPEHLQWIDMELTYSEFLLFCFNGKLDNFYQSLRWKDWKQEISQLDGNKGYSFYPFLFSVEGKDVNKVSRRAVPIAELFLLYMDAMKQSGNGNG